MLKQFLFRGNPNKHVRMSPTVEQCWLWLWWWREIAVYYVTHRRIK